MVLKYPLDYMTIFWNSSLSNGLQGDISHCSSQTPRAPRTHMRIPGRPWQHPGHRRLRCTVNEMMMRSANWNTMRCRCNAVNFLQNHHKIHPMARPLGRDMGCLLCVQILIYILRQSPQWCVQYNVTLDHIITAPDCRKISIYHISAENTMYI